METSRDYRLVSESTALHQFMCLVPHSLLIQLQLKDNLDVLSS